jgi:S1-C subfamily serine protease
MKKIFLLYYLATDVPLIEREWVVAVGNPFNLASTVTGIVSAKARNINIPGSTEPLSPSYRPMRQLIPEIARSLVTLEGKLIGINTAIHPQEFMAWLFL